VGKPAFIDCPACAGGLTGRWVVAGWRSSRGARLGATSSTSWPARSSYWNCVTRIRSVAADTRWRWIAVRWRHFCRGWSRDLRHGHGAERS